jgi:pyruvate dehydrogenase E2 component (dihydrolipoamide acetyltransferase)
MATDVIMPVLGLTMEEGAIVEWLKAEGESVARGEPLLTVEMDKGIVEVEAPASGVLRGVRVSLGELVPVKTVIAEIASLAEMAAISSPVTAVAPETGDPRAAPISATEPEGLASATTRQSAAAVSDSEAHARFVSSGRRVVASPRARLRARERGLDLSLIPAGTGFSGRIVESDVLAFLETSDNERVLSTPLARRVAEDLGIALGEVKPASASGRVTHEDVRRAAQARTEATLVAAPPVSPLDVAPPSRLRRLTAEHMAASSRSTARVTLFAEVDFTELASFRQQIEPEFARLGVARLPWDALIARASALALTEHRAVQAQWVEGQGMRHIAEVHVGVGVALEPEGLLVPVLRNADARSLRDLAGDLLQLVERAREHRLAASDMQGGTFTLTNLGRYRVRAFTPIVNAPETAILGVGQIADTPVVREGQIVPRRMCTLSLSFDHRLVDGAPAAAFLTRLADLLDRPYTLLGI